MTPQASANYLQRLHDEDRARIETYNRRAKNEFKLQLDMGPCPFEGDIGRATVILLLANPGYDETSSLDDHHFRAEGWPLAGLHDAAPKGMRTWWRPRLRQLSDLHGAQHLANRVAALQINPWASNRFDSGLRLPSQGLQLELAEAAAKRGAVLLLMRASRLWLESSALREYPRLYRSKSPRCSYVTQANLGEIAWAKLNAALA